MSKPITPAEAQVRKIAEIPEFVFTAINTLIIQNLSGKRAVIRQCDVLDEIAKHSDIPHSTIFKQNYLDFEPAYREAGWNVVYNEPGYSETYEPNWTFTVD